MTTLLPCLTSSDDFTDPDDIGSLAHLDDSDDLTGFDNFAGGDDFDYLICFDDSGHLNNCDDSTDL